MVASTARSSCLRIGDDVPVAVQGCDPELEYVPPSPNFEAIILRTASSIEGKNGDRDFPIRREPPRDWIVRLRLAMGRSGIRDPGISGVPTLEDGGRSQHYESHLRAR